MTYNKFGHTHTKKIKQVAQVIFICAQKLLQCKYLRQRSTKHLSPPQQNSDTSIDPALSSPYPEIHFQECRSPFLVFTSFQMGKRTFIDRTAASMMHRLRKKGMRLDEQSTAEAARTSLQAKISICSKSIPLTLCQILWNYSGN